MGECSDHGSREDCDGKPLYCTDSKAFNYLELSECDDTLDVITKLPVTESTDSAGRTVYTLKKDVTLYSLSEIEMTTRGPSGLMFS